MKRDLSRGPGGGTGAAVTLGRGEVLFRRGAEAASIFRVESGRIRLERHLEDGAAVTLAVLGPGDYVAEAALFSDVYHCDARAEVGSRVRVFPKREVADGLSRDPEALMRWSKRLAGHVRRLRALLELRSIQRA
ncbi:MAG: cyclic nucleotide-binding domain-containing protein, partial [Acidobacteriota bacterium]